MKTVKLLHWNVWNEEKLDNILELIGAVDPDILCCQELTEDSIFNPGRNMPVEISRLLHADYDYRQAMNVINYETGKMLSFGNAIFSKLPIKDRRFVYVEEPQKPNNRGEYTNRVYVELSVDVNGRSLRLGTVHLSFAPRFVMSEQKLKEAKKLYRVIEGYSDNFILTGDMNAPPKSAIIKGLEKRLVSAGPDFSQKTWATKPGIHGGWEVKDLAWRLDYIFTTPDIKVVSSQIIDTKFSDHLPIVATLEI